MIPWCMWNGTYQPSSMSIFGQRQAVNVMTLGSWGSELSKRWMEKLKSAGLEANFLYDFLTEKVVGKQYVWDLTTRVNLFNDLKMSPEKVRDDPEAIVPEPTAKKRKRVALPFNDSNFIWDEATRDQASKNHQGTTTIVKHIVCLDSFGSRITVTLNSTFPRI